MSNFKETVVIYPDGYIRVEFSIGGRKSKPIKVNVGRSYTTALRKRIALDLERARDNDGSVLRSLALVANSTRLKWVARSGNVGKRSGLVNADPDHETGGRVDRLHTADIVNTLDNDAPDHVGNGPRPAGRKCVNWTTIPDHDDALDNVPEE